MGPDEEKKTNGVFERILERVTRPLTEEEREALLKPAPKESESSEPGRPDDSNAKCKS